MTCFIKLKLLETIFLRGLYIEYTHSSNFFLLSLRDDSFGSIYYKDHEQEDFSDFDVDDLPESIIKVSDSFHDFLSRLYEVED